jgi:hypothetical protein
MIHFIHINSFPGIVILPWMQDELQETTVLWEAGGVRTKNLVTGISIGVKPRESGRCGQYTEVASTEILLALGYSSRTLNNLVSQYINGQGLSSSCIKIQVCLYYIETNYIYMYFVKCAWDLFGEMFKDVVRYIAFHKIRDLFTNWVTVKFLRSNLCNRF